MANVWRPAASSSSFSNDVPQSATVLFVEAKALPLANCVEFVRLLSECVSSSWTADCVCEIFAILIFATRLAGREQEQIVVAICNTYLCVDIILRCGQRRRTSMARILLCIDSTWSDRRSAPATEWRRVVWQCAWLQRRRKEEEIVDYIWHLVRLKVLEKSAAELIKAPRTAHTQVELELV